MPTNNNGLFRHIGTYILAPMAHGSIYGKNPFKPGEFAGVYVLIDPVIGGYYIGATHTLAARMRQHRYDLKHNKHHCAVLQQQFNHHGQLPEIVVIEFLEGEFDIKERETFWMELLRRLTTQMCYNTQRTAYSWKDTPMPLDGLRKHAEKMRGRKLSAESIRKRSEKQRGRKNSPEVIEGYRKAHLYRAQPVQMLNDNGVVIKEFAGTHYAARAFGVTASCISVAIHKKRKSQGC